MAVETLLDNPWFIWQVGVIIGLLFRLLLPYAQKKYAGEEIKFDTRYVWLAVWSWITVQVEFITLFSEGGVDFITLLPLKTVLATGVFIGLGNAEVWNRIFHRPAPTPTP